MACRTDPVHVMRSAWRTSRELYHSWRQHHGGALASEILLFSILSLLPIALSLTAVLGALGSIVGDTAAADVRTFTETQLTRVLGSGTPVLDVVDTLFGARSTGTLTIGVLFALYAASRGFTALVGALDVIFTDTGIGPETRGWFTRRVTGVRLTISTMIVLPVSLVLAQAGRSIVKDLAANQVAGEILGWFASLVGYVIGVAWLAVLYRSAPKLKLPWRSHLYGAMFTVAFIDLLTRVFTLWLRVFDANAVFGVLGAAMSLLWWGYFVSCSVLLGAEISAVHLRRRAPR
jgi:membrane protein